MCPCISRATMINDILSLTLRMQQIATSADASRSTLRFIDYFTIPKQNGNSVVLLLSHPGINTLGRYFSPSQVNDLLLTKQTSPPPSNSRDISMRPEDEDQGLPEDLSAMDLTTFLELVCIATVALLMYLILFPLDLPSKLPIAWK